MSNGMNRIVMGTILAIALLLFGAMSAVLALLPSATAVSRQSSTIGTTQIEPDPLLENDVYFDIGAIHYPVTTKSSIAQRWFDCGLAMCHGFNHEEAVLCFERAIQSDPGFAMAYWGMAYAWGPNINNMQMDESHSAQAVLALRMAKMHASQLQKWEQDLISATSQRYTLPAPEDRTPLNRSYAEALRKVYLDHPSQRLIVALLAESLMDLRPWKLWSSDGTPAPETLEIVDLLEKGLKEWPDDPMLCHLYIHALEASPFPEKALDAANRLRQSAASLGHLVHMPSHIDVRLGRFKAMIQANQQAVDCDKQFTEKHGKSKSYTVYRIHNLHFLTYGAMFDGQKKLAIESARQIAQEIPDEMFDTHAALLDPFLAVPLHALIRFGDWEQILDETKPDDRYPFHQTIWHYARGIAFAASNRVVEASKEQSLFEKLLAKLPDTSQFHNNSPRAVAAVAEAMLAGEIAYRRGEFELAFDYLRTAVQREDELSYDEPWGWMQPTRHALGALLSEQGRFQEAESVYLADLNRHPNNVWSLQGLTECLDKRRSPVANQVRAQFQAAAVRSDVIVNRACMCRQLSP